MKTASLWPGRSALLAGHCGGMVDLVALPVWIGALVGLYGFDPQQAGGLVTLFLAGVVVTSTVCASSFHRMRGRVAATAGFAAAALMFLGLVFSSAFSTMATLHALAGMAVGCAASATHGTMGRSANPHRLFALGGLALGVFALAFLATVPPLVERFGGNVVFIALTAVMACVAVVSVFLFPQPELPLPKATAARGRLDASTWSLIAGVSLMALNQAMSTLVKAFGYASLGISATVIAVAAVVCFSRVQSPAGSESARMLPE